MTAKRKTKLKPDTQLLADITRCNAILREANKLDERAMQLRRRARRDLKVPAGVIALCPEADKLSAQSKRLMFEGYDLEWSIVTADVATVAGYEAKCAFIAGSSFDDDDIIDIAFQLGLDAV
jgi:hypothetical protein